MKCKEVRIKLSEYASEELAPEESREVKMHLGNCPLCMELLQELESTLGLIEKRKRPVPDPFLYTRISARLSGEEKKAVPSLIPSFNRIIQPVVISLLLMAALVTGIKIGNTIVYDHREALYSEDTEYYLNDLEQENLEVILLSDEAQY